MRHVNRYWPKNEKIAKKRTESENAKGLKQDKNKNKNHLIFFYLTALRACIFPSKKIKPKQNPDIRGKSIWFFWSCARDATRTERITRANDECNNNDGNKRFVWRLFFVLMENGNTQKSNETKALILFTFFFVDIFLYNRHSTHFVIFLFLILFLFLSFIHQFTNFNEFFPSWVWIHFISFLFCFVLLEVSLI